MEVVLDRALSERRIFPAINISKSGTRREDLLLSKDELSAMYSIRKALSTMSTAEVTEIFINEVMKSKDNKELVQKLNKVFNKNIK